MCDANIFSDRVVDIWNRLPDCNVTAESVYSFKRRLNSFICLVLFHIRMYSSVQGACQC
jgi:hypothetical protein